MDWVFQYNPKRVQTELGAGVSHWWAANNHVQDMTPGDRVYFFRSGPQAAVVAVGELTSAVRLQESEYGDKVVDFTIASMVDPPLTRAALARIPVLADVPVFRARGQLATNFKLTPEQRASLDSELERRFWDLRPGDSLRRTDLHQRFGGSGGRTISASAETPNVFLFADLAPGQHDRIGDRLLDDNTIYFTGDAQRDERALYAEHEDLANHISNGSTLRLFKGERGTVTYIGAFALRNDDAFEIIPSLEPDGEKPNVMAYHLRPLNEPGIAVGSAGGPMVADVPIEAHNSESYFVTPAGQSTSANRREAELVKDFCEFMTALGHTVFRKRIIPLGAASPLYTDIYVQELHLLVEAKGSATRGPFRTAIGQLADYRRFLERPICAILIPSRPSDDLIDLASAERIRLYWPGGEDFEMLDPSGLVA